MSQYSVTLIIFALLVDIKVSCSIAITLDDILHVTYDANEETVQNFGPQY